MMNRDEIRQSLVGPIAAIFLPFRQDGSIDVAGLRNQIDFVIAAGAHTVLLTYGDSLYSLLTDAEIAEVTRIVAGHVARRAMVVAADREWATPKEVEFAQYARDVGADVLMVRPPDWKASCTVETLTAHYAAVAEHIPVMLVTLFLGNRPEAFALRLLQTLMDEVERVVAVKDDVCGARGRRMCALVHERMAFFAGGHKQNHLDSLPYGNIGYMSTFIRYKPGITHAYWQAISSGDLAQAAHIITTMELPFTDAVTAVQGGQDAGMHAALELFGVCGRWRRPPYYSLMDQEMDKLADELRRRSLL
jgi:dihydrodipicolinate synthase/N-acetylneuraminate lyase